MTRLALPVVADKRASGTRYYVDNLEITGAVGTPVPAPTAEGSLVVSDSVPQWTELLHPGAAGYALVSDADTVVHDQSPTWTGPHTWDDGVGDSPSLNLVGESTATATMFLRNNATAADSDLVIRLPGTTATSQVIIQDSSPAGVITLDAAGNIDASGHMAVGGGASIQATQVLNSIEAFTDNSGTLYAVVSRLNFNPAGNFTTTTYGYSGGSQIGTAQTRTGGVNVGVQGFVTVNTGVDARSLVMRGIHAFVDVEDAGVGGGTGATTASGVWAETPRVDSGRATTGYGVRIEQGAVGAGNITTLTGLSIGNITAGGTNWAINTGTGDSRFGDAVHIVDFLYHDADLDTFWSFTDDAIDIRAGGVQFLTITEGATDTLVINEGGADVDVRIEGVGAPNAFSVRGSDGFIGMGTNAPTELLHLLSATSDEPTILLENTTDDTVSPHLEFYHNTAGPGDNDDLGIIEFSGETSTGAKERYAYILSQSLDVTNNDTGGDVRVFVVIDAAEKNLLQISGYNGSVGEGEVIVNQAGEDVDFRVEGVGAVNALFVQGSDGLVGMGTNAPDGTLHVRTATAGAVTADANANDLVVENSANCGISILAPDNVSSAIYFGSPSDSSGAIISWNHDNDEMAIGPNKAGADLRLLVGNTAQIEFNIGGVDDFTMTANAFNVLTNSHIIMGDESKIGLATNKAWIRFDDNYVPIAGTDVIEFGDLDIAIFTDCDVIMTTGDLILNAAGGGRIDLNGNVDALVLDTDGDTTISAPTDDQIDFEVGGVDDFTMTANSFNVLTGSSIVMADGTTIGQAAGPLLIFDDTNNFLEITGCEVGIGTAAPGSILSIVDGSGFEIDFTRYVAGVGAANVSIRKSRGTEAVPVVITAGDSIASYNAQAYDGAAFDNIGSIRFVAPSIAAGNISGELQIDLNDTAGANQTRMVIDESGHVGIGTASPAVSALLELSSTTGALLTSRMTTAQRNALTAVNGMIIYNSSTNAFNFYENGSWVSGSGLA